MNINMNKKRTLFCQTQGWHWRIHNNTSKVEKMHTEAKKKNCKKNTNHNNETSDRFFHKIQQ